MIEMIDNTVIRLMHVQETIEIKKFYLKIKWDFNFIRLKWHWDKIKNLILSTTYEFWVAFSLRSQLRLIREAHMGKYCF